MTRKKNFINKAIIVFALLLNSIAIFSQNDGVLKLDSIISPSANKNRFEDYSKKEVAVYLPPKYFDNSHRYPVIYYLTGYSTEVSWMFDGTFNGFILNKSLDSLIHSGVINEMIFVVVSSKINVYDIKYGNNLQYRLGTWYNNSSLTGYWEDYIVKELVNYIDSNYRTIPNKSARAISGHSMGGIGAINIGLKHPDVFANIYSINGAVVSPKQTYDALTLNNSFDINRFLKLENQLEELSTHQSYLGFKEHLSDFRKTDSIWNGGQSLILAYGLAFAGSKQKAPYFNFPYYYQEKKLHVDSVLLKRWESGFGNLDEKLNLFKQKRIPLNSIVIEFSNKDKLALTQGNPYLITKLCEYGISHNYNFYEGDHASMLNKRIENNMLPFLSSKFENK